MYASAEVKKPETRLLDVKFIGPIKGCYYLFSRAKLADSDLKVFACRTQSITPKRIVINAPVRGLIGEKVSLKLDQFDIIQGTISQIIPAGFVVDVEAEGDAQEKLSAKIDWLKKQRLKAVKEHRDHKRIMPPQSRTAITLADGATVECFIIDVSESGAAVSADLKPSVGTRLAVGSATGVVVRHIEAGFAVQFDNSLDMSALETIFAWSLNYLKKREDGPVA